MITLLSTSCLHAQDTGELALANRPCRGNRIICKKIDGHISYVAACNPEMCRFYEVDDHTVTGG